MIELYDQFGLPVGLSDHTPGWECDVAATVLGAQVIEKHFTLDKSLLLGFPRPEGQPGTPPSLRRWCWPCATQKPPSATATST